MAAKEIWDYLSATPVTPDYNATLTVYPQRVLVEEGEKNQVVHLGDDDSEEVISFSDDSIFFVELHWDDGISESDAGTIIDFYHDSAKANGRARSFKWTNYSEISDEHTYVVRFASALHRRRRPPTIHEIANVRLRILGRTS